MKSVLKCVNKGVFHFFVYPYLPMQKVTFYFNIIQNDRKFLYLIKDAIYPVHKGVDKSLVKDVKNALKCQRVMKYIDNSDLYLSSKKQISLI